MIYLDWEGLNPSETARVIPEINRVAPFRLPAGKTAIRVARLSWYDEYRLYGITDESVPAPSERYMLYKPYDVNLLDWTNSSIYSVNEKAPIRLNAETVVAYVKFFFHFVGGPSGRFIPVEDAEEVTWLPEATAEEQDEVSKRLMPVICRGVGRDGMLRLTATAVFKDALFIRDIEVAPRKMDRFDAERGRSEHLTIGHVKLTDERPLLEDLNIRVDPAPGEFWGRFQRISTGPRRLAS